MTDLQLAIERGRPLTDDGFSYELQRPLQRVAHHLFKVQGHALTGQLGQLSAQYARQFNRRQEFDAHRPYGDPPTGFDNPEIEFEITTHTLDASWAHRPFRYLQGTFGAQWMRQVNTTDRGGLIPNYDNQTLGVYWIERWRKYPFPLEMEAGLRFDTRQMNIERRGTELIDQQLSFNNWSGTFGAIYHFPKHLEFRLHAGSGWRAPGVNELFSDGVHHGSASYELGRSDLHAERATNVSLTLAFSIPQAGVRGDGNKTITGLTANLSLYHNRINDFIFLEPQPEPVLTIRGAFPAFEYTQTNARLQGLDWQADWRPLTWLGMGSGVAILRAKNLRTDDWLIFMPADRYRHSLTFYLPSRDKPLWSGTYLKGIVENVARQTRYPTGQDYTEPPAAFTLFDLEGGTQLNWSGQTLHLGLTIQNLFNTSYRSYLNRLRYFADEPGRNISVRIKLIF